MLQYLNNSFLGLSTHYYSDMLCNIFIMYVSIYITFNIHVLVQVVFKMHVLIILTLIIYEVVKHVHRWRVMLLIWERVGGGRVEWMVVKIGLMIIMYCFRPGKVWLYNQSFVIYDNNWWILHKFYVLQWLSLSLWSFVGC